MALDDAGQEVRARPAAAGILAAGGRRRSRRRESHAQAATALLGEGRSRRAQMGLLAHSGVACSKGPTPRNDRAGTGSRRRRAGRRGAHGDASPDGHGAGAAVSGAGVEANVSRCGRSSRASRRAGRPARWPGRARRSRRGWRRRGGRRPGRRRGARGQRRTNPIGVRGTPPTTASMAGCWMSICPGPRRPAAWLPWSRRRVLVAGAAASCGMRSPAGAWPCIAVGGAVLARRSMR